MAVNLQLSNVAKTLTPQEIQRATAVATATKPAPKAGDKNFVGPLNPGLAKLPSGQYNGVAAHTMMQAPQVHGAPPKPIATPAPAPTTFGVGEGLTPEQQARAKAVVAGNQIIETPKGLKVTPLIPTPEGANPVQRTINDFVKSTYQAPARAAASVVANTERQPTSPAARFFLGDQPVKPIAQNVADTELQLKDMGVKHGALPLAFAGVVAGTTMDLFPGSLEEKNIAANLVKNPDDIQIMREFIDNVRLKGPVDHQLELDASRIAEHYGMKPAKTTTALANEFDKHLSNVHADFAPSYKSSEAFSGPLDKNPEAGFARLPGAESDPVLQKQFDNIDKNVKAAKAGTGGQTDRVFKGGQFDLSPVQTENLAKIQDTLGLGKRNVRSFEDMTTLANELGTDPKQLLHNTQSGQISDAEVKGISDLIKRNSEFITESTARLNKAATTAEKQTLQTQITAAEEQIKQGLTKLRIGNTENGRAIVANRILAKNTMDPVFWYGKAEKQLAHTGTEFTPEIRNAIDDLIHKKDTTGLAVFVANLNSASNLEKAVSLWKAGLLTSPTTHLANIAGNVTMAGLENTSDVVATGLDKLISLATGKRTKSFSLGGLKAQAEGAAAGLEKVPSIMSNGRDLETALSKMEIPRTTEFKNPILDKYTKAVFGSLSAEDKVFRETATKGSIYEQARVAALNEGLTGAEFKARVKALYENPTDEMVANAIDQAEFRTFNNENKLSTAASSFKSKLGPLGKAAAEFVAPFTKTPTNIAARMVDYSPAGFVKTLVQQLKPETAGQKALVEGLARNITGTSIIALGGLLAAQGLMTGNTPTDPQEKAQWDLEGKQAHAVKIGDKWLNLNRVSPMGNLLSLGASIHDSKSQSVLGKTGEAIASGAKGLTEQTFLQGVSSALSAVNDPQQNAESYVSSSLTSLIPSVVTKVGRLFDPVVRSPKGLWETVESKIPGLTNKVAPKRDALGNVQKYNALGQLIDPFSSRTATDDPVVKEFRNLGSSLISPPDANFKSLKVTSQEKDKYLEVVGQITRDTLAKGIQKDSYKKLSTDEKRDAITKSVSNIRSGTRAQFIATQIAKELSNAKTKQEQADIWQNYQDDGTLTKAAEKVLRQMIKDGKVPKR